MDRPADISSEDAFRIEQSIQSAAKWARSTWPRLAISLYTFHRGRGWRALGYDTFNEWLAQSELGMSRSSVYAYIDCYQTFCVDHGEPIDALAAVDASKVRLTLRAVKGGVVEPHVALSDALSLSKSDLRAKYACPVDAEQDDKEEPEVCPTCGQKVKT